MSSRFTPHLMCVACWPPSSLYQRGGRGSPRGHCSNFVRAVLACSRFATRVWLRRFVYGWLASTVPHKGCSIGFGLFVKATLFWWAGVVCKNALPNLAIRGPSLHSKASAYCRAMCQPNRSSLLPVSSNRLAVMKMAPQNNVWSQFWRIIGVFYKNPSSSKWCGQLIVQQITHFA